MSALDSSGAESGLSFVVRATIPAGTNTNEVTLTGFSFSPGTAGFHVYRGLNPSQLLRIAANVAVATSYTDAGATAQLVGPPDANYDHANFYWRLELQPEEVCDCIHGDDDRQQHAGDAGERFRGRGGADHARHGRDAGTPVIANTSTTLTVAPAWTVIPDTTSFFVVADSTWNFGGLGATSPVKIEVPNRAGSTVEISGRSANVLDQESAVRS